jgi:FtsH-binding integral membrane protein
MLDFITDAFEEPAFWILAGGGVAMELLGWIMSKKMMDASFSIWTLLIIIVVTILASAFFATKD